MSKRDRGFAYHPSQAHLRTRPADFDAEDLEDLYNRGKARIVLDPLTGEVRTEPLRRGYRISMKD